ncbi:MAG: 3-oxoacyl-ACP synthase [Flavobacteriaceae bacterium]|nr:3-oxoacyl-ACP synthase [Flavobacteriaceae bacterium]
MKNIKEEIFLNCKKFVEDKLEIVNQIIISNQNALQSETKSSAGDKHETGRAMLQLEMEKASQQFSVISNMNEVLQRIDIKANNKIAKLGSLIHTSQGRYFLAISVGKINIVDKEIFVISPSSPIGKLLLGKVIGETIYFNGKEIKILDIY